MWFPHSYQCNHGWHLVHDSNMFFLSAPQSYEDDEDRDGKNDILHLFIEFSEVDHNVTGARLLLFFEAQFRVSVLQSLINIPSILAGILTAMARVWFPDESQFHHHTCIFY